MAKIALEKIKKPIVRILKKYGVKKAALFGSYVRGEQKKRVILTCLSCRLGA